MKKKLSCAQVVALFSFYIEDKLNSKLKKSVESHLFNCPLCRHLYSARNGKTDSYDRFGGYIEDLSAYVDNELSDTESVRIRKLAITNPVTRKNLENMYAVKSEMHKYFSKLKNDCKTDYSKNIIGILNGEKTKDPFNKLVWAFTVMLSVVLAGFIAMLYF